MVAVDRVPKGNYMPFLSMKVLFSFSVLDNMYLN